MGTGTVTGDAPYAIAAAAPAEMPGATSSRHHEEEALRQYYIAVDRQHFKMGTLVDLLTMLGRRASLPVAVCCSSRDSLDAVWSTVSASQEFSLSVLTGLVVLVKAIPSHQEATVWMIDSSGNQVSS